MEKNKLLVVYNTCGFSGREPVDWYIDCIQNLLNQDLDGVKVVLSSCGNSGGAIKKLFEAFGRRIVYNLINDRITVNMSFNHTGSEMRRKIWGIRRLPVHRFRY